MKVFIKNILLTFPLLISCENFLEIEPPINQLVGESVFEEVATVDAALAHLYIQIREDVFTQGRFNGITFLLGHYADELEFLNQNSPEIRNFYNNNVLPTDDSVNEIWNSAYNIIYDCNVILEGVNKSKTLNQNEKDRFIGEAYFIRSFIHFYLMNLFG